MIITANSTVQQLFNQVNILSAPWRLEDYGVQFDGSDDTAAWIAMIADINAAGGANVAFSDLYTTTGSAANTSPWYPARY